MFGGYDPNLIGATKGAKFFIQRGRLWDWVDELKQDQKFYYNHTLMAAVPLTSETVAGSTFSTNYGDIPNCVMYSFLCPLKCFASFALFLLFVEFVGS